MTDRLSWDWETRSAIDITDRGSYIYARDKTTSIMCAAWAFEGEEPEPWLPGQPCPERVRRHIEAGGILRAWNAVFEFDIWNEIAAFDHGFPPVVPEQIECVMAESYSMGFPGKLERAAIALGLEQEKDAKGGRVMLQISQPRGFTADGSPIWWEDADKFAILYEYCKQDVRTEMAAGRKLHRLSEHERQVWLLDFKINRRGIRVDEPSVRAAMALVESEKDRLDQQMRAVTGETVAGCTDIHQLKRWAKAQGLAITSLDKPSIVSLLAGDLPDNVRQALTLRQEAGKTSVAKLPSMIARRAEDGRMRGLFQYHGSNTGRWAGRGPQPHNFERATILKKPDEIEDVIAHFGDAPYLDMMYGQPTHLVADCMRGMLVPGEGNEFIVCDYSNIEGRILAWLADESWKVKAFRDYDDGVGPDLYLVAVARSRGIEIELAKPFRQEGKVEELAFQYEGGEGAMSTWCRTFGLQMNDAEKERRKNRWRAANPAIKKFWKQINNAAIAAVRDGAKHEIRGLTFRCKGTALYCKLLSGRVICYPYPQIEDGQYGDCLTYAYEDGNTHKWVRGSAYGGSLTNNVTQAIARDILVDGMIKLDAVGHDIVMHVHDEIVIEAPIGVLSVDKMATVLSNTPQWAEGLPLAASGYSALRYRKD